MLHAISQDLRDKHGQLSFRAPHILFQFVGPIASPILSALGFPENHSTLVPRVGSNYLLQVGPADAFTNLFHIVVHKCALQLILQI
jgi:hypothetical protein